MSARNMTRPTTSMAFRTAETNDGLTDQKLRPDHLYTNLKIDSPVVAKSGKKDCFRIKGTKGLSNCGENFRVNALSLKTLEHVPAKHRAFLYEKELESKHPYYYNLRKSFERNPNSSMVMSNLRKTFSNGSLTNECGVPVLTTRQVFYEIHEKIEKGRSLKTMKGLQILTGTPVTLRILPTRSSARKLIDELLFQVDTSIKCESNPYIMRTLESFTDNEQLFVVSEYSGHQKIEMFPVSSKEDPASFLPRLAYELLICIKLVHEKGLIHGAINNKNVFVNEFNEPKFTNFSLQRNILHEDYTRKLEIKQKRTRLAVRLFPNLEENINIFAYSAQTKRESRKYGLSDIQTEAAAISEKIAYYQFNAPELHDTDQNLISRMVDVWSLGVLFFYIAYRRFPFKGVSIKAIKGEMASQHIDFPAIKIKGLEGLNEIITLMLRADPSQRPSIDEILGHRWLAHVRQGFTLPQHKLKSPEKALSIRNELAMFLAEIAIPHDVIETQLNSGAPCHLKACLYFLLHS
jgi:serine/threonine protein kinase